MVKTVMSGIPASDVARMPPFKNALTEGEIREVVDFVRGLMPPQPVLTPADMKRGGHRPREGDPRDPRSAARGEKPLPARAAGRPPLGLQLRVRERP
jgi:hypothetical protein